MFSFNDEVLLEELNLEQKKKAGKKSTLIKEEKKITQINLKRIKKADSQLNDEDLGELVKLSD